MNRIYQLVWSCSAQCLVPVAETTRRGRKSTAGSRTGTVGAAASSFAPSLRRLCLALVLAYSGGAQALPQGGQVVAGSMNPIDQTANSMTVHQTSQNLAINWQSFGISAGNSVHFNQPSASSIVLNRVLGQDPSQILGSLSATGQVFISNPNGVLFGAGAQVNVGGLVATTNSISDADFMAGNFRFTNGGTVGSVVNKGTLTAADGGYIALLAPEVRNEGIISARLGTALLAAGNQVTLNLNNGSLIGYNIDEGAINALAENKHLIKADGGRVFMSARAADDIARAVVNNEGVMEALSIENRGGTIVLAGDANNSMVTQGGTLDVSSKDGSNGGSVHLQGEVLIATGSIDASGATGGTVQVDARRILQSGAVSASGDQGSGGTIKLNIGERLIQTESARLKADGKTVGGNVTVNGSGNVFSSATMSAISAEGTGGTVKVLGDTVQLYGANIDASGQTGGGTVLIGGDYQGKNAAIRNASNTTVNFSTRIKADAKVAGNGGKVVVWSDEQTKYYGDISARGGAQSGDGGQVEVSGKENLTFGGMVDAGAANGAAGTLLLDPKNITISETVPGIASFELIDPNPGASNQFGASGATVLGNGNIIVANTNDDLFASNGGAVYLFNGSNGSLISTLVGTTANDRVGSGGITLLNNGNYLVRTSSWDNGTATDAGAVTWGSATAGVSGAISAANSLVGTSTSDQIGNAGITLLSNGNYLVRSSFWDNGTATDSGAVTWGSGTAGVSGTISAANSLVGTSTNDRVGNAAITLLSNGNYLVRTSTWDNGTATDAGAVTWGSGTAGVSGAISAANSLVGTSTNDQIGSGGITLLSNGNYLVRTSFWDNGTATDAGAVTWGSGTAGVSGAISAANSLVGTSTNDQVGNAGITLLSNGNYVVSSPYWDNGTATDAGAVTWGSATAGVSGTISAANSLVGTRSNDQVGIGGTAALSNGNYVVGSSNWANGTATAAGAATWANGATGISGTISAANSLVGTKANDQVSMGGIHTVGNGNYVVRSYGWDNGTAVNAGAVTWGNGETGITGAVSAANSLVGTRASDAVGISDILVLSNGNYLVRSELWDNGTATDAGAVTWGNGATGVSGAVSAANSLVGTSANDRVSAVTLLSNGNYVVSSYGWDNGTAIDAGAVTWGSGTAGVSGTISAANSLVGTKSYDTVGLSVFGLSNGNYVVSSWQWGSDTAYQVGAVTLGNGTTGTTGQVSAANSLVGTTQWDQVGRGGTWFLNNGNFVVRSADWDNGAATDAGAVTWVNGTTGLTGAVSAANSLVGTSANDRIGDYGLTLLSNDNYLVKSSTWDNGTAIDAGAVTWGSGTAGVSGVLSAGNSLVGTTASDRVGGGSIYLLSNGNYLVASSQWDNGTATDAGAVTWGSGTAGVSGAISAANSLVGTSTSDQIGSGGITLLSNGNYVVRSYSWDNGTATNAGAATWGSGATGVTGAISAANSLVGTRANDRVGWIVDALADGNFLVRSPFWNNGTISSAGAATWGSGTTGVSGTISIANSRVGTKANDQFGSGGVTVLANGAALIRSPLVDKSGVDSGRIDVLSETGTFDGRFNVSPANDVTISTAAITAITNTGTAVTLQANNDITLATGSNILTSNAGNGGALTLQAGRSITLNSNITTDNGNLTLIANERTANGVVDAHRDAGAASITMASGTSINAGTGDVTIELRDGAGKTHTASGDVSLQTINAARISAVNLGPTAGSNIVLNGVLTATGTGNALTLAGNNFINNAGVSSLSASNGRWLVYSASPEANAFGGLASPGNLFGRTYAENAPGSISVAFGNRFVYSTSPTLTVTTDAASRIYGDSNPALTFTVSGLVAGDNAATALSGSLSTSATMTSDVGSYAITQGTVAEQLGYTLAFDDTNRLNVTQRAVNISGTKVYDGALGLSTMSVAGLINGDVVTAGGSANFVDKNVGTGKMLTTGEVTLAGAKAGNYTVTGGTHEGSITAATLAVTGVTAANKVYDATTAATLGGTAAVSALGSDAVTLTGTGSGTFADKNVGNGKAVTVTGYTISGADAGNYTLVQPTGVTADITPASLSVTGITAANKVYDTTTAATLTGAAAISALGADEVTLGGTGSGTFADKNVGNGKAVTVTGYTISGSDAGNYTLVQPTGVSADITPASLLVTGVTAANKVYDATTAATLGGTAAVSALGSDAVTLTGTGSGTFADKNVGNGKAVTVTGYTISGSDAGNYTLVQPTGVSADITPASLFVTGVTAANKVYDATTVATLTGTAAVSALGSDVVALGGTGSGTFADKNVGNGKAVTVTGYTISGADAGNYTLLQPTGVSADITPASLFVTGVTAADKVYDTTTAATLTGAAAISALGADEVTLGGTGSGTFADKNAGNGKSVTVTGYTIGGADAGNYALVQPAGVTANITPAALSISGITASNKTYDGTTVAAVNTAGAAYTGLLGSDSVTVSATGTFADKNAGNNKAVTLSSTYAGADAANYTISDQTGATASITPKALTVTANDASKSADGAAYTGGNGVTYSGFVAGEGAADLAGTLAYGGSSQGAVNAGTYAITPGGLTSVNYAIANVDGTLTISPAAPPPPPPPSPQPSSAVSVPADARERLSSAIAFAHGQSGSQALQGDDERKQKGHLAPGVAGTGNISANGNNDRELVRIINGGMQLPQGVN